MPEIGITRELSVGEVNQIQHRHNVIIIASLAVIFLGAFFFSLRDLSPIYSIGIILLLGFFLLSFINIRIGFVLVILAFLLSPEINLPMSKIKDFTIRTEDLLIVVMMLAWLGRLAMGLQKNFFISTLINLPIILIIVWNALCSWRAIVFGWVEAPYCIMTNLKLIEFYLIFFLIANNLENYKEAKFLLCIFLILTLVICVYVYFQIPKTQIFTTNRLTAPFEGSPEPNTLGAYLAIFFGIALSIFIYSKSSFIKNIAFLLILLLPLPIMFSLSRSAYIITLAMMVLIGFVSRRKWLIFLVLFFLVLSPFILPKVILNRAMYNFIDPRYGHLDSSFTERFFSFQKLWGTLKYYPIFGLGLTMGGGVLDSQYARVGIETGILGLILFLWLILRVLKMGIQLFKISGGGWIKGFALGFIVVVMGVALHGLGNITLYIVRIAEPFWALVGIAAFLVNYLNKNSISLEPK